MRELLVIPWDVAVGIWNGPMWMGILTLGCYVAFLIWMGIKCDFDGDEYGEFVAFFIKFTIFLLVVSYLATSSSE